MKIRTSPTFPLFVILLITSDNAGRVLILIAAAFIHECGHLLAAKLMRLRVKSIRLGIFGAGIEIDTLKCTYKKEIILCAAGPAANLFTAATVYLFHETVHQPAIYFVIASLFLAFLNLLPAKGFDGGRIASCILIRLTNEITAYKIIEFLSFICFFVLWSTSVYIILRTGAYLSLFIFSWNLFMHFFIDLRPLTK